MRIFEFGPFVLDSSRRQLLRGGVPQPLPPKAFDVLVMLVENRHRVLPKDEMLRTLWADTFIEEANLSQHVFVLRRTLNDGDTNRSTYIATVPRRGYRFTAEVIERLETEASIAPAALRPPRPSLRWVVASFVGAAVVATALLAFFWRDLGAGPDPRVLVVTALPGLERYPSVSPDGNFVVFSWTGPDADAIPDLWVKAVDDDVLRRLTDTPEAEFWPAWSPDGREIAFVRAGRGVFITSARGGHERQAARSGSVTAWTPDSRALMVRDITDSGPNGIFRVDLTTGERRLVTQAPTGVGDWTFNVSPDGSRLAFIRYERPGVSDVHVVPISGGEALRRTSWNSSVSRVSWMPDGRELIYAVHEASGLGQTLFRIPADGERPEQGRRALHVSGSEPSASGIRPDGSVRVAFTASRTDVGLRMVDLGAPHSGDTLAVSRFADSTHVDFPGRFSRGGEQIAFLSDRSGWAEAWLANRDGSGLRQVTTLKATELQVGGWSPDDRRFVIDAAISGNSDIYIVNLDGGPPVRLTTEAGFDLRPDWSDDGRSIYFTSDRSGRTEIWKISVDGGAPVQITRNGGLDAHEGPDGRTLFYLDRAGHLKEVSVDGGDEIVVANGLRFGLWSVTDQGIVFLRSEREEDTLEMYSFADRSIHQLGRLPFLVARSGLGGLVVRSDRRWALASTFDHRESDIMVADGFR